MSLALRFKTLISILFIVINKVFWQNLKHNKKENSI